MVLFLPFFPPACFPLKVFKECFSRIRHEFTWIKTKRKRNTCSLFLCQILIVRGNLRQTRNIFLCGTMFCILCISIKNKLKSDQFHTFLTCFVYCVLVFASQYVHTFCFSPSSPHIQLWSLDNQPVNSYSEILISFLNCQSYLYENVSST